MAKQALGMGARALFETASDTEEHTGNQRVDLPEGVFSDNNGILFAELDRLKPNPHQPREEFDEAALAELAQSIKEYGVIQPVTIEADSGELYIIAGERRTRAARLAGLTRIPVQLGSYTDEQKLAVALIENIQRENLNPIEEAAAYRRLMEISHLTQEEAAQRVGKNRSTVANALRLLKLPEDMQAALSGGSLSAGHARALLSVINPSDQRVLFARIIGSGMSVREAEEEAARLNGGGRAAPAKTKKAPIRDRDIAEVEENLIRTLGTKVVLSGSLTKGTLHIDYFSRADLDELYELLTAGKD